MSLNYSRLLRDEDLVEHFLDKVLQFDHRTIPKIIQRIVISEKMLLDFKENENTLISSKHRDRSYKDEINRWDLRKQVIDELFTQTRLEEEDETSLTKGGLLPNSKMKNEKKVFIIIGPPASGKSGIANKISEDEGAIILDSDYAKRKLPEFEYPCGATLVQEESNRIVFGFKEDNPHKLKSVYQLSIENSFNMVIPKIGKEPEGIIDLAVYLTKIGYEVNLTLVSLKRREATIRAVSRFDKSKRYVPLGYIFDQIGNDPILTYYLIKAKGKEFFSSFGAISTDVDIKDSPICIDLEGNNPASHYKQNLAQFF
jgi:hypothetical protein